MHLGKLYHSFSKRCNSYENRIIFVFSQKGVVDDWQFNNLTEVLISDIWQSWNHFCRELFLISCRGCKARDGSTIIAIQEQLTWKRLCYLAKSTISNKNPTATGHASFFMRSEPTWGDLSVFVKILNGVKPNNFNHLMSTYGSFNRLKHMQNVRNACAHKNVETINELKNLSTHYGFMNLKNAPEIAWKTQLNSSNLAIEVWLDEMRTIADLATSRV